jgi:hypothetical protein
MQNDREKIIAEYHSAVGIYRDAVSRMAGLSGTEFENARVLAEQARAICEHCRALLDQYDRKNQRG